MEENKKSCWGTLAYSFFTGALLGAGLALLFAPVSGKETREAIHNQYDDLKDRLKKMEEKMRKAQAQSFAPVDEEEM
jgi:gas vesicle protein